MEDGAKMKILPIIAYTMTGFVLATLLDQAVVEQRASRKPIGNVPFMAIMLLWPAVLVTLTLIALCKRER